MIDVSDSDLQNAQEFATLWGRVEEDVQELGGEVLDTYALLGRNDFLVVFDAPDLDVALQASLAIERYGLDSETMVGLPVEQLGEVVEDI